MEEEEEGGNAKLCLSAKREEKERKRGGEGLPSSFALEEGGVIRVPLLLGRSRYELTKVINGRRFLEYYLVQL